MPNYRNTAPDYMRRSDKCGCSREIISEPCGGCSHSRDDYHTCCKETHKSEDCLSHFEIAMAYVPWQNWNCPYPVEKGLHCGTIFKELDKPFCGKGGCNR